MVQTYIKKAKSKNVILKTRVKKEVKEWSIEIWFVKLAMEPACSRMMKIGNISVQFAAETVFLNPVTAPDLQHRSWLTK